MPNRSCNSLSIIKAIGIIIDCLRGGELACEELPIHFGPRLYPEISGFRRQALSKSLDEMRARNHLFWDPPFRSLRCGCGLTGGLPWGNLSLGVYAQKSHFPFRSERASGDHHPHYKPRMSIKENFNLEVSLT